MNIRWSRNNWIIKIAILSLSLCLAGVSNASVIEKRLSGRILLQVESKGQAWYINPDDQEAYYLGRPSDAFQIMKTLGLGISNRDFDLLQVDMPKRIIGKIIIKVEDFGKAYYINPLDSKAYYLGRPSDAFQIMRTLGLGISNNDLNKFRKNTNNLLNKNTTKGYFEDGKLIPYQDKIYFGAFPNFGGREDFVSGERIDNFEKLLGENIYWAYFSDNWDDGIKYPKEDIDVIYNKGVIPFVRMMPRSDLKQYHKEENFSLENIINGNFDKEIHHWAQDAKENNIPLLIDFAVEMNGDWFPWSGYFNGKGEKEGYGDKEYFDGPEKYRDAYRHIIDIFREEKVFNVTWFFHPDIHAEPEEEWNKAKYYYPGDDYIDWIGFSIYGPQNNKESYWETFSEILKERYRSIKEISNEKPIAILEFGVSDDCLLGKKEEWIEDAFSSILNNQYFDFKAISYWHENWQEENGALASIQIDSSKESLDIFKRLSKNEKFIHSPEKRDDYLFNESQNTKKRYQPHLGESWQWQLTGNLNIDYDVDLYDIDLEESSKEVIDKIHKNGAKVICYFNAGAYEPYREDASKFSEDIIGKTMEGWEDEKWLDISKYEKFSDIMTERMDLAVFKNCDGIEPDNIDGYQNDTGFNISYDNQLEYNKWLANEAHRRNLSIALKNDIEQAGELVSYYDFAINEECFYYNECEKLEVFSKENKAVLGVEYELDIDEFCERANSYNYSWLKMSYELNGGRYSCRH